MNDNAYFIWKYNAGAVYRIVKWTTTYTASFAHVSWTEIATNANLISSLVGLRNRGLLYVITGTNGIYQQKLNADGTVDGAATVFENTKTWVLMQTRVNAELDRPVYGHPTQEVGKLYRITDVVTKVYDGDGSKFLFEKYNSNPQEIDLGRYVLMQQYPGKCTDTAGSEDYDYMHVKVLSFRTFTYEGCHDGHVDAVCGNGKYEPNGLGTDQEFCDDGNVASGDGCDANCNIEVRWVCDATPVVGTQSNCTYTACGNSWMDNAAVNGVTYNEACDDGNTNSGDGCKNDCSAIEDGYKCTPVTQNAAGPSVCTLMCHNGAVDTPAYHGNTEICDEGANAPSPLVGCTNFCKTITSGYKCPTPGQVCVKRCGDSTLDDPIANSYLEKCDDGNILAGDGCSIDCQTIEFGYKCPTAGSACTHLCGDGTLDENIAFLNPAATYTEICDENKPWCQRNKDCIIAPMFKCIAPLQHSVLNEE